MDKPLAEQVAELERERDALLKREMGVDPEYKVNYERLAANYDAALRRATDAERALASAKAEGAREGFVDGAEWYATYGASLSHAQRLMVREQAKQEVARTEYPAPASGAQIHGPFCDVGCECGEGNYRPATPSAPERVEADIELRLRQRSEELLTEDGYRRNRYAAVVITPADARRIVGMAQGGTDA